MIRISRRALAGALVALAATTSPGVFAQDNFPDKTIRLIVPYPPGGFTDMLGRILAAELQPALGQPVIVENKGGGGSTIGTSYVARAPADGYTLLLVAPDFAINESLMESRLNYDARKDFTPVIRAATSPMVLVTHPSLPVKNVAELIALAKAKPGTINIGSGGVGTGAHLALELFKTRAEVDLVHVPYKGNGPASAGLLGGQVTGMYLQYAVAKPHITAGKLRALATPSGKRLPGMPELPTIAESGLPGFDVEPWFGVVAPAGTPTAIVQRLNAAIAKVLQQPNVTERLASVSASPSPLTAPEFARFIDSEVTRWADVVKKSGAKVE